MTKIINDYPPNYAELRKHFDVDGREIYYTYGDTIYNPRGRKIDDDFILHEEIHMKQQAAVGGPEEWWRRFIEDPMFRIEQEAEAYGKQVRYTRRHNAKNALKDHADFAHSLAGPIYGSALTESEAYQAIYRASMTP